MGVKFPLDPACCETGQAQRPSEAEPLVRKGVGRAGTGGMLSSLPCLQSAPF